jgi:hypothetical protein
LKNAIARKKIGLILKVTNFSRRLKYGVAKISRALPLLLCSERTISGNHPRATGFLPEFSGFSGTLKVERVPPSNAFRKTQ